MRTTAARCPEPVDDRRRLSDIAYGFLGSKALFAALGLDLFSRVAEGARTVEELSAGTAVAANRMRTLVRALAAVGLLVPDGDGWVNAPAAERHLVRGAAGDFGEYFRLQVGQQIYPALLRLDAGLAGAGSVHHTYADLLSRPEEARTFTAAQHAGSAGAARVLADRVDLGDARTLLDVGGGSGAFTLALCAANPRLRATVLDFPAVLDVAREYRAASGLAARIALLPGDAVHTEWPAGQDVVLMSYLLSAVGEAEIDIVLARARRCLRPGGRLVVHDFALDDDGPGPAPAALWFLQYVAFRPDAVSFSAGELRQRLADHGFRTESCTSLIPEITALVVSREEAAP